MKDKELTEEQIAFTTETGLNATYQIIGNNLPNDVKIRIKTKCGKTQIHSAINEAGIYFDEVILPSLVK